MPPQLSIRYHDSVVSIVPLNGSAVAFTGGISSKNPFNAFDAVTTTKAWSLSGAAVGDRIVFDGATAGDQVEDMIGVELFSDVAGYTGTYDIQWADASAGPWTSVSTAFGPSLSGWNNRGWETVGGKRFWALRVAATGTGEVFEVQWRRRVSDKLLYFTGTTVTVTIQPGLEIRWNETAPLVRDLRIPWSALIKYVDYRT